jgi:hypothetical protein
MKQELLNENAKIEKYDTIVENRKKYYTEHKGKILERMMESITCDKCGRYVSRCYMKKHQRSKVCQKTQALKEQNTLIEIF